MFMRTCDPRTMWDVMYADRFTFAYASRAGGNTGWCIAGSIAEEVCRYYGYTCLLLDAIVVKVMAFRVFPHSLVVVRVSFMGEVAGSNRSVVS